MVGKTQNTRSTSSALKRLGANRRNPSGTAAQAAAKVRMYGCNRILPAIMKRKLGKVGASMYACSRSTLRPAGAGGGRLKVIASIEDPELIERILTHRAASVTQESLPFVARAPPPRLR